MHNAPKAAGDAGDAESHDGRVSVALSSETDGPGASTVGPVSGVVDVEASFRAAVPAPLVHPTSTRTIDQPRTISFMIISLASIAQVRGRREPKNTRLQAFAHQLQPTRTSDYCGFDPHRVRRRGVLVGGGLAVNAKVRAAKKIVGRCSIVLAVPFGTGCALDSSKTGPTEATTTTAEAWTTNVGHTRSQHVLTISLPVGVALDSVVLSARGSIRIGDGTNVKGSPDASSKVTNTGTGHTDIGVAAALQDVLSLGPITLHSGAQIDGSVTSAATVL